MDIDNTLHVRTRGIDLSTDERATLEDRLLHAVDRFAHVIQRIGVMMTDVNGPRGGVDVRCTVHAVLSAGGAVDVHAQAESPLKAFAVAADRLQRALARTSVRRTVERHKRSRSLRDTALADAMSATAA